MLTVKDILKLRLGGFNDNITLSGAMISALASNPLFSSHPFAASTIGASAGILSGMQLAGRYQDVLQLDAFDDTELKINSDAPPVCDFADGVHLGYIVGSGEPLIIPLEEWKRHASIAGQTGVGKTVLGEWLMFQQILRGGGLLWVDGKYDGSNIVRLREMCAWAGRESDMLVINPADPSLSNTYNPIQDGDPDEVSARIMSIVPASESSPGSDHYRQGANQGITTLVASIQATNTPGFNFLDLVILLMNPRALESLLARIPDNREEKKMLALFIDQFRVPSKQGGGSMIDMKKLKDMFGGIGGRLFQFGTSKVGQITSSYNPHVNMYEAIMSRKIIYLPLPTLGKTEMASNFGKLAVGDFKSAIARIQLLPKHLRPPIPFLGFFDEAGAYMPSQSFPRIAEQARSANCVLCPAVQTKANYAVLGEELLAMVVGNTKTKVFFQPGESDTAEWMSNIVGEEKQITRTTSTSTNDSVSSASIAHGKSMGMGYGSGSGVSEKIEDGLKITPSELFKLQRGECIVSYDGNKVYHVKVPMLNFSPEYNKKILEGGLINDFHEGVLRSMRGGLVAGIDLHSDIDRWLDSGTQDELNNSPPYKKKGKGSDIALDKADANLDMV